MNDRGSSSTRVDLVAGLVLCVGALVLLAQALRMPDSPYEPLGPRALPIAACAGIAMLSALLAIGAVRRLVSRAPAPPHAQPTLAVLRRPLAIYLLFAAYVATVTTGAIPYVASTAAFFFVVAVTVGERAPRALAEAAIGAAAVTTAMTLVFGRLMHLDLP